jgi:hypothetical protein
MVEDKIQRKHWENWIPFQHVGIPLAHEEDRLRKIKYYEVSLKIIDEVMIVAALSTVF